MSSKKLSLVKDTCNCEQHKKELSELWQRVMSIPEVQKRHSEQNYLLHSLLNIMEHSLTDYLTKEDDYINKGNKVPIMHVKIHLLNPDYPEVVNVWQEKNLYLDPDNCKKLLDIYHYHNINIHNNI